MPDRVVHRKGWEKPFFRHISKNEERERKNIVNRDGFSCMDERIERRRRFEGGTVE
jgi:hypothetical protein